jgi:hypothetical protein
MATPVHGGWYAAIRGSGAPRRGHVVFAVPGTDGSLLGRIEGEPGGPSVIDGPRFAGLEFHGPFSSPEAALERLLGGDELAA